MTLHKRLLGKVRGAGATLGALECWPTNVVGEADSPCLFELVAAGAHSDDVDDDEDQDDNDDQLSYAGCIIVIREGILRVFFK